MRSPRGAEGLTWRLTAVVAVLAAGAAVPVASPVHRETPRITEAADAGPAVRAAREQHEDVTVLDLTTPTRKVSAKPDGSLEAELTALDPQWHAIERGDWAKVFSGRPDSTSWYGANDSDTLAKVGTCTGFGGCGGVGVARTYFQFDTGFLADKRLLSATLSTVAVFSPSCVARGHQVFQAASTFNAGLTWNNAPQGRFLDSADAPGVSAGCAGDKAVDFDVTSGVDTTGWSAYYLKAADESDRLAWRKYDPVRTRVVVNYEAGTTTTAGAVLG